MQPNLRLKLAGVSGVIMWAAVLIPSRVSAPLHRNQNIEDARILSYARRVGFDLSRPQTTEFWFYFSSDTAADSVARTLTNEGFAATAHRATEGPDWITTVSKRIVLTLDTLTALRQRFQRLFDAFGGYYGWNVIVPPDSVCGYRGVFVGPCDTVHARMFPTNGSPWIRLWKVGTQRILGVWGMDEPDAPSPCPLPPQLERLLDDAHVIYGDFVVRPVSASKPGVMQQVCIASASGIVVRPSH